MKDLGLGLGGKDSRPSSIMKYAVMAAVGFVGLLFLHELGFLGTRAVRNNYYIVEGGDAEARETRSAMESLRSMAAVKPWQQYGQCQKELSDCRAGAGCGDGVALNGASNVQAAVCPACPDCKPVGVQCTEDQLKALDPSGELAKVQKELQELTNKYAELQAAYDRLNHEKSNLDAMQNGGAIGAKAVTEEAIAAAKQAVAECSKASGTNSLQNVNAKGCTCEATEEELTQYFNYTVQAPCPDDWFFVQNLIFGKNCYSLPKRRCLSRTPRNPVPTLPFPRSLWDQSALDDRNVRWDLHNCKSFECLNTRLSGDCRNCFNLDLESNRWKSYYRGAIKMQEVIDMKNGSLRIGLDAGGGTGSFAAHMAKYNVTILTTAMNIETVVGKNQGMPYMEAIALRGLVPLHVPHKARLPFFDNTLDVIHSVNSIKYLTLVEFEELVMEWDRVLRPGGIMWFEMFYAPVTEMPLYVAILDVLQYKKLYWNHTPKPDRAERGGDHVYLNCVIEKPARID